MTTPHQKKIFQFIQDFIKLNGYSPTLQEIAVGIGISARSKSLISRSVHALADAGWLTLQKGHRNIQLSQAYMLPIVGRIAAGTPIEAIETHDVLDLCMLLAGQKHYVLEVKGDSMMDEGILDGDKIICRGQASAQEGDIVIALIDQYEATLKRISYQAADTITLLPANSSFKPQQYAAHRVQIQGVFVGLLRLHYFR